MIESNFLFPFVKQLISSFENSDFRFPDFLENPTLFLERYYRYKMNQNNADLDKYMERFFFVLLCLLPRMLAILDNGEFSDSMRELKGEPIPLLKTAKRRPNFSLKAQNMLNEWIQNHPNSAEATNEVKLELSEATGLDIRQISRWLVNKRRRIKK